MIYKRCKGHRCDSPHFPMLDWNPVDNKCFCAQHPCHHDMNGDQRVIHNCHADKFLTFTYTHDQRLQCNCQDRSTAGSPYLARELCPGHGCEDSRDILDYDEAEQRCICRKHPCLDDNGMQHGCTPGEYPILAFHYEEDGKLTCKCSSAYKPEL